MLCASPFHTGKFRFLTPRELEDFDLNSSFIIYTSDLASLLASLLASRALLAQLYADDVQAFQHFRASDAAATARAMSIAMEALGT